MSEIPAELMRVRQLLDKLQDRSLSCRGLFPVSTRLEFLNLSSDQQLGRFLSLADLSSLGFSELQKISRMLEYFWPSLCPQILAQGLLRHRPITLQVYQPGNSDADNWLQVVERGLKSRSETACQNRKLGTA
jgi:hypothetical protein